MRLLAGSSMTLALVALLATAGSRLGTRSGLSDNPVMSRRGDVPEVVVTAERPDWLMPEVVVPANQIPEVVVRGSWPQSPVAFDVRPSEFFAN
ncbi:hypothetical protein JXD38_12330 [candidate division WOR-3 bacterium]|nr:hypothetical protein [candidate division WOR-3 bacterium]